MAGKNQRVVQRDGDWGVHGAGNTRDKPHHDTQAEAIAAAREIARNQRSEVITHGRDARSRSKDIYGNDPNPP